MNVVMLTKWQSSWQTDRLKTNKETIFNCFTFSCMSLYTSLYGVTRVCWMQQNEFTAAFQTSQEQWEEKAEFILEQATKAQCGSRASLLFLQPQWVGSQHHVLATLPPGKRPSTHHTGGWEGPRASLDSCRKSNHHQDSIPWLSSA
jgi:hypothetical protein